jgi:UDP-N-acetylglucosamine--N-acetylmuramyl-(pentapeptide) pyrophosphoryl-undecaprenol N-acetylglucosamine transferase
MRILVSGGGTGGHIYPILALVSALMANEEQQATQSDRAARPPAQTGHTAASASAGKPRENAEGQRSSGNQPLSAVELRYVGEAGGMEEALAARAGIPFSAITSGQIRGRAPWVVARNLVRMVRGAVLCSKIMRDFKPDVIFVTGGYVTVPVTWAAARHARQGRRGVPLMIYLPDLTPGLAIQHTSRRATRVAVSFSEVAGYFGDKAIVTGYPVREELLKADKHRARAALQLREDLPVLLVFGGSRGAHSINQALVAALPALLSHCQVLHVSGQADWAWISEVNEQRNPEPTWDRYHPYPYLHDEMIQALAAADLVIARAGASTLGEFPAVGLPSILVPYPYAGQHQHANAAYLADRGAAVIVEDAELPEKLEPTVLQLLDSAGKLMAMATAATALARPDAATNIVRELRKIAWSS